MASLEYVLVGTADSKDDVATTLDALLGNRLPGEDDTWQVGAARVWLSDDDLTDEPDDDPRISGARYELVIAGGDQVIAARETYDALVGATGWLVVLTADDGNTIIAVRPAEVAVS